MNDVMDNPLDTLVPVWHPILPSPSEEEVRDAIVRGGPEAFAAFLDERQRFLERAAWDENMALSSDPFRGGFDLPHWADADLVLGLKGERTLERLRGLRALWLEAPYVRRLPRALCDALGRLPEEILAVFINLLILLGGNRSGKSEYCAKRVVESAMENPGSLIVCVAGEDIEQCIKNMERPIWKYLPVELKRLKGKRDPRGIFHINYDRKGGFTLEKLILPNGSEFLFYGARHKEPAELEGKMLGHPTRRCVGFWADESVNLPWMEKLITRANYYNAIGLWSFTPVDGMTPAIKELVGEARTLMSLPAEFLSQERKHVDDCPAGWMPYLQIARTPQSAVMYFHTQLSPFGSGEGETFRTFYDALKIQHADNSDGVKARYAYGFTRDTSARCFPMWGPHNVVKVGQVPEVGTLRMFIDPHGNRPYAMIKVLTTAGKAPEGYVVGDWPDQRRFGEWAVPTKRATDASGRKGLDGDKGPAQTPNGWAALNYKKMIREWTRIVLPMGLKQFLAANRESGVVWDGSRFEELLMQVRCPWHRPVIREAVDKGWRAGDELHEKIYQTFMDSRACAIEQELGNAKKSLKAIWESTQTHPITKEVFGPIAIYEASGRALKHGYKLVTDLLEWDREHPDGFVRHINAPRLYAVEEATQFRWAMENFTDGGGHGDQDGACKEWPDLARHYAEEDPRHVRPGAVSERKVWGGY